MAIDSEGNVFLVGTNTDDNFPATPDAFEPEPIGPFPRSYPHDGFLIKFDPTLKHILYGTFLGDNAWDEVIAVALDPQGNAYATGDVGYRINKTLRRVYKIDPEGSDALYIEAVPGGYIYDIAVDAKGCAYVTGNCGSKLQTTPNAYQRNLGGKSDFVRKLNPSGNIVYSTLIRRIYQNRDSDTAIAVDTDGSIILGRTSEYPNERVAEGVYDTTHNGGNDVYIFKLDPTGSQMVWATYLGGSASDRLKDLTIDAQGNVYVTGRSKSSDFPTTGMALGTGNNGDHDVFIAVLDASGAALLYSTVLGGKGYDTGQDLALDQDHYLYVAGTTRSADFPTSEGAFQRSYSGLGQGKYGGDVFVVKLDMGALFRTVTNLDTGVEYTNLQSAIDEALPSNSLEVGSGRYHESVIIDKSLTIQGMDPNDPNTPAHTVLIGDPTAPTLTLVGRNTDATVAGLTLSQGTTGLWCDVGVGATVQNCHMTNNTEAGMVCLGSHPWIHHCIMAGNQGEGLALRKHQSAYPQPVLDNCTIVQNADSGILGGKPVIANSIIYFNGTDDKQIDAKSATVTYSCVQGDFSGRGNIDSDPCFVSLGYTVYPDDSLSEWIPGDYHLQSQAGCWNPATETWTLDSTTSPCIDAGDPDWPISGEPMPNGNGINMGAYGATIQASKGAETPARNNTGGAGNVVLPPQWPWPGWF